MEATSVGIANSTKIEFCECGEVILPTQDLKAVRCRDGKESVLFVNGKCVKCARDWVEKLPGYHLHGDQESLWLICTLINHQGYEKAIEWLKKKHGIQ